jgi:hypothetical protein
VIIEKRREYAMEDTHRGQLLREKRLERGWSAETAGVIYGNAVRGKPITEGAIYTLEEGKLPKSVKRRWVLARMFDIPPAVLGLSLVKSSRLPQSLTRRTRPVDVVEYQKTLMAYWKQGYSGTAEEALRDLQYRINALHDHVLYVNSDQKEQMKRLLCGYHMRRAEVAKELGYDGSALDHVNKALILAKEENYTDLTATAYYRRGEIYFDAWNLQTALRDFKAAQSVETKQALTKQINRYPIPPQVKGRILNVRGLTQARLAQSDVDLKEALRFVDLSERYISAEDDDNVNLCTLDLTGERYFINRAKSLLEPPLKKIHLVSEAEEAIAEIRKQSDPNLKRFHGYALMSEEVLQAIVYLDKRYYPIATAQIQDALRLMKQMSTTIHLPVANRIYDDLRASSYGKSVEVAELGLQILFIQYPQLFN